MAFEWTIDGLNIVDYDLRIIIDSKKLGDFTIGQILQSSVICSNSNYDKTINNCRKWTNDVMGQLKQYNHFSLIHRHIKWKNFKLSKFIIILIILFFHKVF